MPTIEVPENSVTVVVGKTALDTKVYLGSTQMMLIQHVEVCADVSRSPELRIDLPDMSNSTGVCKLPSGRQPCSEVWKTIQAYKEGVLQAVPQADVNMIALRQDA